MISLFSFCQKPHDSCSLIGDCYPKRIVLRQWLRRRQSEALQKTCDAKRQLQLVVGWYEVEATLRQSALERGDWFAPAGSQPHLSPGDYQIVGIEGTTRYVENLVGDPYVKRFSFLIAGKGVETRTPFLFGISARERILRERVVLEGEEEE